MIVHTSDHRAPCSVLPAILLAVTALWSLPAAHSEEADDVAQQDPQLQSAREADRNGELARAAAMYRQALESQRDNLPKTHPELRQTIVELEDVLRRHGERLLTEKQHRDAIPLWQELVTVRTELWEKAHWRVGHAERVLELCKRVSQFDPGQQKDFERLASLQQTAWDQLDAGKFAEAQATCLQVRELLAQLFGEDWFSIAYWVAQSGFIHAELGDVEQAEEHLQRSLEIRRRTQGEHSPNTAANLGDLGWLREQQQDYTGAADYYSRRLAAYRRSYEDPHLDTANALHDVGRMADTNGNGEAAITAYKECIELYRQLHGNEHETTALALFNLGVACTNAEEHEQARVAYRQSFEIRTKVLGAEHPDTISSLHALGESLQALGELRDALARHRQCLKIRTRLFGEQHEQTSASLHCVGQLLVDVEDYEQAESILQRNLKLRTTLFGHDHEVTAASIHAVASLRWNQDELSEAAERYAEALAIRQEVLGENHIDTCESQFCLAQVLHQRGRSAEALQHARASVINGAVVFGPEHPEIGDRMDLAGRLCQDLEQTAMAHFFHQGCLELRSEAYGEEHPATATSMCHLGLCHLKMGDANTARPLLESSLEIRTRLLNPNHLDVAQSHHSLGLLYLSTQEYDQAEKHLQRGLEIRQSVHGREHADIAASLLHLGRLFHEQQDFDRSATLLQESLAICEATLGTDHPVTLLAVRSLGHNRSAQDDHQQAAGWYCRSLEAGRRILNKHASFQSEQQQLETADRQTIITLTALLAMARRDPQLHKTVFREVLEWKGATLLRQRRLRHIAASTEAVSAFAKLRENSALLSEHAKKPVTPESIDEWSGELMLLTWTRDRLAAELNSQIAGLQKPEAPVRLAEIQAALPADAALLTFVEFYDLDRGVTSGDVRQQLAVFVLSNGAEQLRFVELGPSEPVAKAVDQWRHTLGGTREARQASQDLRQLIWSPVEPLLNGADTILISPEGPLEQFPFAVLPGKDPDRFLLEDYRLATLPIPRLLPELAQSPDDNRSSERLLLVGDVDYDGESALASTGSASWRQPSASVNRGSGTTFSPLPGTVQEIATIQSVFKDQFPEKTVAARTLTGADAGEEQFCQAATAYTHLHLATHGFYHAQDLDPIMERLMAGGSRGLAAPDEHDRRNFLINNMQPGLESGLVFSGANQPTQLNADDGILTAADIAALPLDDVRLVVLSACESGLGKASGGEGMLGVQRAFQVAGAQTTIASLWPVSDVATQVLMERFYRNLWEKKMSRLEALREAQLHLLNHPKEVLNHDSFRGDSRVRPGQANKASRRLSPQFWAAFTLSGAWE